MALIDRVKERVESDLTDDELQRLIDEANEEVIARWGPHADPTEPITVELEGRRQRLGIVRPIDEAEPIVVTETQYGETTTTAPEDYSILSAGRTLKRLGGLYWARSVEVTYTPVNDGNQRQNIIIQLVQLAVEFEGVASRRVGDVDTQIADYTEQRERLLASLAPRKGLTLA